MNDAERALRGEIIRTCLAMEESGINQGTSGNVSARWGDGLLITPSGLAYATMAPEDIIYLEMDGTAHGPHAPSSEWRFHRDIMRERTDVSAIVHAHPTYLTAISILNQDIPAVHYMIAAVGGPTVRCAKYATYGTGELSQNALAALEGRMGCMLGNHGVIACGATLGKALWLAGEMETLARQFVVASSIGKPVVLSDEEIANVIEKFKSYGPRRKDEPVAAPAAAPASEPVKAEAAPETAQPVAAAKAAAPKATSAPARKAAAKKTASPKTASKAAPSKAAAPKKKKTASEAAPSNGAASRPAATKAKPAASKRAAKAASEAPADAPAAAPAPAAKKPARARKSAAPQPAATDTSASAPAVADAASAGGSKATGKKPAARRPRAAKTGK